MAKRGEPLEESATSRLARNWTLALGGLSGMAAVITLVFPTSINVKGDLRLIDPVDRVADPPKPIVTPIVRPGRDVPEPSSPVIRKASTPPSLSDYEKYIDPHAYRVAGATNVAIALRGLPGTSTAPLESAMRRGLSDRSFTVIPLFRESFRRDEAALRLFNGDAALANRLRLQEHCDSLLLGVLRFVGPAQSVDDGLYIREAVLDIHAIDPGSGQVMQSLEIREKGGGESAELSTVNALTRLEEKVETHLSEWSWI